MTFFEKHKYLPVLLILLVLALGFFLERWASRPNSGLRGWVVTQQAKLGDEEAQVTLGTMYLFGSNRKPRDIAQAVYWYEQAAEQKNPDAYHALAEMYRYGFDVEQDNAKWFKWTRLLAESGDAAGQNTLGVLYEQGTGVARDYAQATQWYMKAADQKYPDAYSNLFRVYNDGLGVPVNKVEALRWLRLAVQEGGPELKNAMGVAYETGSGVEANRDEAVRWYLMAADEHYPDAIYNLCRQYAELPDTRDEGVKWCLQADSQGDSRVLPYLYFLGRQLAIKDPIDLSGAVDLFTLAAFKGNLDAQKALAGMYAVGNRIPQNPIEAYAWYSVIVSRPDVPSDEKSKAEQGRILMFGKDMRPDEKEAAQKKAAEYIRLSSGR